MRQMWLALGPDPAAKPKASQIDAKCASFGLLCWGIDCCLFKNYSIIRAAILILQELCLEIKGNFFNKENREMNLATSATQKLYVLALRVVI